MITQKQINSEWVEYRTGNIFDYDDITMIVHQTNCMNCMRAGIALQIANRFPEVVTVDHSTVYGDQNKLGTNIIVPISSNISLNNNLQYICNMYAQFAPGHFNSMFEYNERISSLNKCFNKLKLFAEEYYHDNNTKLIIGIPWMIGCGISGLNDEDVYHLIINSLSNIKKFIKIIFVDFNNQVPNE